MKSIFKHYQQSWLKSLLIFISGDKGFILSVDMTNAYAYLNIKLQVIKAS